MHILFVVLWNQNSSYALFKLLFDFQLVSLVHNQCHIINAMAVDALAKTESVGASAAMALLQFSENISADVPEKKHTQQQLPGKVQLAMWKWLGSRQERPFYLNVYSFDWKT